MKRLFWGLVGVGLGAAVGVALTRWVRRTADAMTPASLSERAMAGAQEVWARLGDAWAQGRAAMAEREAELHAPGAGPVSEEP